MSPKASVSDPFVVRLARQDDVDGLLAIADAGGEGMTTVPNTRAGIAQRVEQSLAASRGSGP
ncbi:MAG: arginine N-succinyltransferase, partial [Pseudomonadota bacterium]